MERLRDELLRESSIGTTSRLTGIDRLRAELRTRSPANFTKPEWKKLCDEDKSLKGLKPGHFIKVPATEDGGWTEDRYFVPCRAKDPRVVAAWKKTIFSQDFDVLLQAQATSRDWLKRRLENAQRRHNETAQRKDGTMRRKPIPRRVLTSWARVVSGRLAKHEKMLASWSRMAGKLREKNESGMRRKVLEKIRKTNRSTVQIIVNPEGKRKETKIMLKRDQQLGGEMTDAFALFDKDGSGEIDSRELKVAMRSLGFRINKTQVAALLASLDADKSGTIGFDEFLTMMTGRMGEKHTKEDVRKAFNLFRPNQVDDIVSKDDFERVARQLLGNSVTDEKLRAILAENDDNTTKLNLDDFNSTFTKINSQPTGTLERDSPALSLKRIVPAPSQASSQRPIRPLIRKLPRLRLGMEPVLEEEASDAGSDDMDDQMTEADAPKAEDIDPFPSWFMRSSPVHHTTCSDFTAPSARDESKASARSSASTRSQPSSTRFAATFLPLADKWHKFSQDSSKAKANMRILAKRDPPTVARHSVRLGPLSSQRERMRSPQHPRARGFGSERKLSSTEYPGDLTLARRTMKSLQARLPIGRASTPNESQLQEPVPVDDTVSEVGARRTDLMSSETYLSLSTLTSDDTSDGSSGKSSAQKDSPTEDENDDAEMGAGRARVEGAAEHRDGQVRPAVSPPHDVGLPDARVRPGAMEYDVATFVRETLGNLLEVGLDLGRSLGRDNLALDRPGSARARPRSRCTEPAAAPAVPLPTSVAAATAQSDADPLSV